MVIRTPSNISIPDNYFLKPADIIVERVGDMARAVDKYGNIIAESTDHADIIQNAIDYLKNGGIIWIRKGKYAISKPIRGSESVHIIGLRGKRNDSNYGTVLDYQGSGGAVLDFTEITWFGISGIKILMNGKADYGIRCGTTNLGTRPKHLIIEHIEIDGGGYGTGIDFGDPSWAGVVDDTEMHNVVIRNCSKGIAGAHTEVKLYHFVFAGNTYGIYVKPSSSISCYGCIWSGNEYDIMIPSGNDFINQYNFFGCWFEASSKGILAKEDTVLATIGGINFFGCNFSSQSPDYAMDLSYVNGQVSFYGGRVDPSSNRKLKIGSYATVNMYMMQVEWDLGNSVIDGLVRRQTGTYIDLYDRTYVYAGKSNSYSWITIRPRGSPTTVARAIIDLHQNDALNNVAILRLSAQNDSMTIESSGFGTYTPVPLKLRYVGADKIVISDTIQKIGVPYYSDCANIPASGDYTGEVVACYDSTNAKYVIKVWDGSAWQTIG